MKSVYKNLFCIGGESNGKRMRVDVNNKHLIQMPIIRNMTTALTSQDLVVPRNIQDDFETYELQVCVIHLDRRSVPVSFLREINTNHWDAVEILIKGLAEGTLGDEESDAPNRKEKPSLIHLENLALRGEIEDLKNKVIALESDKAGNHSELSFVEETQYGYSPVEEVSDTEPDLLAQIKSVTERFTIKK